MSEFGALPPANRIRNDITAVGARYVDEYRSLPDNQRAAFIDAITDALETLKVLFVALDDASNSLTKGNGSLGDGAHAKSISVDESALRNRLVELYANAGKSAEKTQTRQFCILYSVYKLDSASGVQLDRLLSECTSFCLKIEKPSLNADVNKMTSPKTGESESWVTSAGKGKGKGKYKITPAGETRLRDLASELGYLS